MSAGAPDRLGTNIPAGEFGNEKQALPTNEKPRPAADEDDDEDIEDIDALIDDLESQEGGEVEDDEEEAGASARPVPEDLLRTDTRQGLTTAEVENRRRKYGLNQMKEEKENLVLKFLMYFVGPIQFVMEVSFTINSYLLSSVANISYLGCCRPCCRSSGLG
jgi:H+-transporting ATPase